FKLALSPYNADLRSLTSALASEAEHDFDSISLWYTEKNDAKSFSRDLWHAFRNARGLPKKEPEQVLGPSYFETPHGGRRGSAYTRESRLVKRLRWLAEKDQTFRDYLTDKQISLDSIAEMDESVRASDIRKMMPVAALREYFRAKDPDV